jgi:hypothetical protein
VLRKPNSNNAQDDLDSVERMIQHFAALKAERPGSYVPRLLTVCEELYGMARRAMITKTGPESRSLDAQVLAGVSTFDRDKQQIRPADHSHIDNVSWDQVGDQFATPREMVGTSSPHPALRPMPQDHGHYIPNFPSTPDQMGQGFLNHLINPWIFDQLPDDLFMFDTGWNAESRDNARWG